MQTRYFFRSKQLLPRPSLATAYNKNHAPDGQRNPVDYLFDQQVHLPLIHLECLDLDPFKKIDRIRIHISDNFPTLKKTLLLVGDSLPGFCGLRTGPAKACTPAPTIRLPYADLRSGYNKLKSMIYC